MKSNNVHDYKQVTTLKRILCLCSALRQKYQYTYKTEKLNMFWCRGSQPSPDKGHIHTFLSISGLQDYEVTLLKRHSNLLKNAFNLIL
jgi:hypothetical protein